MVGFYSRAELSAPWGMTLTRVTRQRMHLALNALGHQDVTVGELAHRLGYRSEAAFARAFKRVIGTAPGSVRRAT